MRNLFGFWFYLIYSENYFIEFIEAVLKNRFSYEGLLYCLEALVFSCSHYFRNIFKSQIAIVPVRRNFISSSRQ